MFDFLSNRRHAKLQELLSSYIDDQVTPGERRRVERHLAECADCRAELESLRLTVSLLRDLPEIQSSRSFAIPESQPLPQVGTRWYENIRVSVPFAAPVAAAVVVGLVAIGVVGTLIQTEWAVNEERSTTDESASVVQLPAAAPAAPAPAPAAAARSAPVAPTVAPVPPAAPAAPKPPPTAIPVAAVAAPAAQVAPAQPAAAPVTTPATLESAAELSGRAPKPVLSEAEVEAAVEAAVGAIARTTTTDTEGARAGPTVTVGLVPPPSVAAAEAPAPQAMAPGETDETPTPEAERSVPAAPAAAPIAVQQESTDTFLAGSPVPETVQSQAAAAELTVPTTSQPVKVPESTPTQVPTPSIVTVPTVTPVPTSTAAPEPALFGIRAPTATAEPVVEPTVVMAPPVVSPTMTVATEVPIVAPAAPGQSDSAQPPPVQSDEPSMGAVVWIGTVVAALFVLIGVSWFVLSRRRA